MPLIYLSEFYLVYRLFIPLRLFFMEMDMTLFSLLGVWLSEMRCFSLFILITIDDIVVIVAKMDNTGVVVASISLAIVIMERINDNHTPNCYSSLSLSIDFA